MNWIENLGQRPAVLVYVAGGALFLNLVLAVALLGRSDSERVTVVAEPDAVAEVMEAATANGPAAVLPGSLHVLRAEVDSSLARTFQKAEPEKGDVISAVVARLFWWDLDLRADLQRGDAVQVLYRWENDLPVIEAASYNSRKLGKTITAYRYQATGDAYASWWSADGEEIPKQINAKVMESYEQITALVNDRVRHHGIDFKANEGTPIYTPKAGTVTKTNWNLRYNGNGVEVRFDDGTLARFLHLSRTDVKEGARLNAGDTVGLCGNTGRSTAAHLHYELEKNGKVMNPIDYHGTSRRNLPESDRAAFETARVRLDGLLNTAS